MLAKLHKTIAPVAVRTFYSGSAATAARASAPAPPHAVDFAPPEPTAAAQSLRAQHVELLKKFIEGKKVVFITGAGISTESGLPDYRSPRGRYGLRSESQNPVFSIQFMSDVILLASFPQKLFKGPQANYVSRVYGL